MPGSLEQGVPSDVGSGAERVGGREEREEGLRAETWVDEELAEDEAGREND